MIYFQLFLSFLKVGLFSIGGGYAAMPIIQSQVVERYGWLSFNEFTNLVTIAEMTPGPIAVNAATFVGIRIGGIGGALTATFGCILPSLIIVSLLFFIYYKYKNMAFLQSVLKCLRPAAAALIAGAGLSILIAALFGGEKIALQNIDFLAAVLFLGAFILLRKFKLNPILVMLLCGVISLAVGVII